MAEPSHKRVLTNLQRRDLHAVLVARGVDPARTRWSNAKKGWTTNEAETLEAGLCHFLFASSGGGTMSLHMKPAANGGLSEGFANKTWEATLGLFAKWASIVAHEFAAEDPWAQYATFLPPQEIVSAASDNSPFTYAQAEQAEKAVQLFLEHVKRALPDYSTVQEKFDPQFSRLAQQAKQGAGRIDWSNQFVGMMISLCLTLSLSPETASALWHAWMSIIDTPLLK